MIALGGAAKGKGKGRGIGLFKRKGPDNLRGVEPDLNAPRKCPRTQVDLSGLGGGGSNRPANQMWLIKVPPSLYSAWMAQGPDSELGKLVVSQGQNGEELLEVKVAGQVLHGEGGRRIRLPDYTLAGMRESHDTLVFSQSKEGWAKGGGAHIAGEVVRSYNMQPQAGDQYRGLMQQRLVSSTLKDQFVKRIEGHGLLNRQDTHVNQPKSFELAFKERELLKQESAMADVPLATGRRERMDPAALRSKLFELFSEKERYFFKDINALLQQPEDHLKQVMREISEMHRAGPYRNQYELKVEYKLGGAGKGGSNMDS